MSFRKNPAQQMSLFDTTYNLTEREKKALRMRTESDVRSMLLI